MELNIPKCQMNVVLHYLQLLYVMLEMWLLLFSHFYFWIFKNKVKLRLYQMSLKSLKSAATSYRNSKLVYLVIIKIFWDVL